MTGGQCCPQRRVVGLGSSSWIRVVYIMEVRNAWDWWHFRCGRPGTGATAQAWA